MFHAEPYCGSDTKLKDTGLGQGADVMLGLIEKCNLSSGCTLTFDNLFTSLPLLDELWKRGIGGLETLRQNRLENTPVPTKQLIKKTIRGSHQGATNFLHLDERKFPGCNTSETFWKIYVRVDSINQVVIKGKSKYTRCKVCKRRSVFECHKCHVTLHPASCFKRYHESSFSTK